MTKLLLQSPTMTKLKPVLFALLFLAARPLSAVADTVEDMYTVSVPVSSYAPEERAAATREALRVLLVRLTGDSNSVRQAWMDEVIANAQSYVLQFGYTSLPDTGDGTAGSAVTISFSEPEINRLMRQQQLPVWPANRPRVLVWMVTDTPELGKHFLSRETDSRAYQALEISFARRAVPLQLPLLDLSDQMALTAQDAWEFNSVAVRESGLRYDADLILVLRFFQTSRGDWRGAWLLANDGPDVLESIRAADLDSLLANSVDQVVDRFAGQYTYVPTVTSEAVSLVVSGVTSFADFSQVTKLFSELEMVRHVRVMRVLGDQLHLSLAIEGDVAVLQQAIAQDARLEPSVLNPVAAGRSFTWRGSSVAGG